MALTDVDDKRAAATYARFPNAKTYKDFRKMLDKEEKNIDAVIVTIPDFMHATVALAAMERGKHVYVQKPLTRTVWEARALREAAQKYNVATQMGNQGYAQEGTRVASEMIWNGDIGDVTEVHAWTNRPIWPQGLTETAQGRAGARYSRLGPVARHPEHASVQLGLHALQLARLLRFRLRRAGRYGVPRSGRPQHGAAARAAHQRGMHHHRGQERLHVPEEVGHPVDFPARGTFPAVKIFWHDGVPPGKAPYRPADIPDDEPLGDAPRGTGGGRGAGGRGGRGNAANAAAPAAGQQAPADPRTPGRMESVSGAGRDSQSGVLFVGSKGYITCGEYGGGTRIVPESKAVDYKYPPPILNRSPGTYADWVRACKGGDEACSNFNVSAPFTEWIALGVVALRFPNTKLEYDATKMRVTNVADANQYLRPAKIRAGYKLAWKL